MSRLRNASAVSQAERLMGVRMAPGPMELTRMPLGASSCAIVFMSCMMPPLLAA